MCASKTNASRCQQIGQFVIYLTVRAFCVSYLTKRFHFAVCLFSYRPQMTLKCAKDKIMTTSF